MSTNPFFQIHAPNAQLALAGLFVVVILAGCGGGGSSGSSAAQASSASATSSNSTASTPSADTTTTVATTNSTSVTPVSTLPLVESTTPVNQPFAATGASIMLATPSNDASDVKVGNSIVIAYREKVDPASTTVVSVSNANGAVTGDFSVADSSIIITPRVQLPPAMRHTVNVQTNVIDGNGAAVKTASQINFTTASTL